MQLAEWNPGDEGGVELGKSNTAWKPRRSREEDREEPQKESMFKMVHVIWGCLIYHCMCLLDSIHN
jgi:hypothetical protein